MKIIFFLILIITSSTSFAASIKTFLGSINDTLNPITYNELKERIKEHSLKKGFLSLGESHLQASTAIKVNFDLMQTYFSNTNKNQAIFCTETLDHFLAPYASTIQNWVESYKVFYRNSPNLTDFAECKDKKKYKNYVTYSGFFHQYQFAKEFQHEFGMSSVLNDYGNNIKSQMRGLKGLFVTQMELEYMEFSASKVLLKMGIVEPSKFRQSVAELIKVTDELNDHMEEILESDDPYTSKKVVVLNARKDFKVHLNSNKKSYVLMTNLSYRKKEDSLKTLKKLALLDDLTLGNFLQKLKQSNPYIVTVFIGPFAGGNLGTLTYPGVNRVFKGQSLIMHIQNDVENYLMVMEPDANDFLCVDYKTSQEIACF